MSRIQSFLALLLLSSTSLFAEDVPTDRWRLSILASEISLSSGEPWSDDAHGGVGVGIAYTPAIDWDVELTVSSQTHRSPYTRLFYFPNLPGIPTQAIPVTEFRRYRVTPIDLSLTRHFLADQPIAPYLRAGVRYVDAPDDPSTATTFFSVGPLGELFAIPVVEGFGLHDRTSAQAGAGARIRLTPRTALRAEVNRLLRSEGADFDPLTRYAVGLSWVF